MMVGMWLAQIFLRNSSFPVMCTNWNELKYFKYFQVKYAPKVKVSVIGGALSGGRIPEYAQLRLECKADANPNDVRYRWYINEEPIIGGQKTEMVSVVTKE